MPSFIFPFSWTKSLSALLAWMLIWMAMGVCFVATAQPHELSAQEQYVQQWSEEAVYQMAVHGIPASITLAQGILESGSGRSQLAAKSNNHFGIKCHKDWTGAKVFHDDDSRGECFRSYENASESFQDHSAFLKRDRYQTLFELESTDYKGWAKGLKKCGYATNPKYASLLIQLIEQNDLGKYDQQGLALQAERIAFAEGKNTADAARHAVLTNPSKSTVQRGRRAIQLSERNIEYILAADGDSYPELAVELDMMPWQFYRYNDIDRSSGPYQPKPGDIIYLQPKRKRGDQAWLTLRPNESVWQASQRCGVQLKSLVRMNRLSPETPLPATGRLSLQWRITPEGKLPNWVRMLRGPGG